MARREYNFQVIIVCFIPSFNISFSKPLSKAAFFRHYANEGKSLVSTWNKRLVWQNFVQHTLTVASRHRNRQWEFFKRKYLVTRKYHTNLAVPRQSGPGGIFMWDLYGVSHTEIGHWGVLNEDQGGVCHIGKDGTFSDKRTSHYRIHFRLKALKHLS